MSALNNLKALLRGNKNIQNVAVTEENGELVLKVKSLDKWVDWMTLDEERHTVFYDAGTYYDICTEKSTIDGVIKFIAGINRELKTDFKPSELINPRWWNKAAGIEDAYFDPRFRQIP